MYSSPLVSALVCSFRSSQECWPDQLNPKQLIDTDPREFAKELRNEPTVNMFASTKWLQTINLENIIEISVLQLIAQVS